MASQFRSWTLQGVGGVLELGAEITHNPPLCETNTEHTGARFRWDSVRVAPTCERLDARALKEAGRAVLVVPVVIPAVVDGVDAAVLLLQLHVVKVRGHRRHRYLFCLTQTHVNMDEFRPRPTDQTGSQTKATSSAEGAAALGSTIAASSIRQLKLRRYQSRQLRMFTSGYLSTTSYPGR